MSLSTIQTIYSPSIIATVPADDTFTNAFALNEPGLYELSCPGFDWYYGTAPGLPLGSMTLVPAGSTASFTIAFGDPAITRWVRGAPTIPALINVLYTPSINGTAGGTGFTTIDNTAYGIGAGAAFAADLQHDTAIGYNALNACTTGINNTAVGAGAMALATLAGHNVAVGANALAALTTSDYNVAVGYASLFNVTVGTDNVGVGYHSLLFVSSGIGNIAIGTAAGANLVGASSDNVAVGFAALGNHAGFGAGYNNTAVGSYTLSESAGGNSTAVGYRALRLATGDFNTAMGSQAGANQTTPLYNVLIGYGAGSSISTGGNNTALGALAGSGITTGTDCVAIGKNALQQGPVTGNGNIAIGTSALTHMGAGARNIAIGSNAGASNIVGNGNVFIGESAGQNSTDSSQTLVGDFAGFSFNSGVGNTALGYGAMQNATTGNHNIAIGANAGGDIVAGVQNIMIGWNAGVGSGDLSNFCIIGSSLAPINFIGITSANAYGPGFVNPMSFRDRIYMLGTTGAPSDANIQNGYMTVWVDEAANRLRWRIRYSDGSLHDAADVIT